MHQERQPMTASQLMAQIRELQNKVTSLSDASLFSRSWIREQLRSDPRSRSDLYYSESQNLAALRFWIAAWYTKWYGYYKKRFWSTICSSQGLRPDTPGTARKNSDMKKESLNTSVPSPHVQSKSGMLNRTDRTYSHNGIVDCPRIPISELNLGNFPDSVEFQSWKVNFRTEVRPRTADPQFTMLWIKEVEIAKSIDELMTPRSIVAHDFLYYDMLDAMIASVTFPKKSKCRRAACSKIRPTLTRKTNCVHDLRVFPCNQTFWSRTKTLNLVRYKFTEWWRPRFRRQMGSCSIFCEWNALRCDPGTSDCDGFVWSRNGAKQGAELSQIENSCKTSYWSDDEDSKLQDQSPRVKKERKPTLSGKWESVFSGRHMDNVSEETHVVPDMTHKLLETVAKVRDAKDDRLVLHPIRRQNRLTARVKNPHRDQAANRNTLWTRVKFHAGSNSVKKTWCKFWHPPVCEN